MKFRFVFILVFLFTYVCNAQIDSKKQSGAIIPAVESPKDSADSQKVIPKKVIPNSQLDASKSPNVVGKLNLPKKEFSMFPQEEFANPGDLYSKRLNKIEEKVLPEGHGLYSGLKEDAFWGDYRTKSKYIDIYYRDHGLVDGDIIHLIIDDEIIKPNIYLNQNFIGFRYPLKEGINKIEVLAINEGAHIPNTAQYKIVDQWNYTITNRVWSLAEGVKTILYIVKE